MKKIFIMMAAAASLFAAACDKTENDDKNPGDEQQKVEYTLTATPLEGSAYGEFTDTEMRFVLEDGVLKMNKVKFAERMPRLDIEVPGIPVGDDGTFTAESIIPTYAGVKMPQYEMTNFELTLNARRHTMTVTFDCMNMHVEYVGWRE